MKKILFITLLIILPFNVFAADQTIEMLNKQGKESMVYSQKIVRVNVGETVFWKSTDKGHNVEFIRGGVPEGVDKFKTKYNVDVEYKFTIPGIYAYWCTPHKNMGMIAVVVVDNNLDNIEAISSSKVAGKSKGRLAKIIDTLSS